MTYLQGESFKECVEIETELNGFIRCSSDHPLMAVIPGSRRHYDENSKATFIKANKLNVGDLLLVSNKIGEFGSHSCNDAYLLGLLFGDGSYSKTKHPTLSVTTNELYE